MENVQDKTALITGGGSGIGYSIAEELLRKYAKKIAIVDLPMSNKQQAVTTLQGKFGKERIIYFPCDITKTEDFKETFKEIVRALDGLDILINNAGILNDNLVEQTFNVNVVALIRSSLMGLDYMGKHKGGKGGTIVNVASLGGLKPVPNISIYSTSKCAVITFSRCLQTLYDKTNIRILTLCPGLTKTELMLDINSDRILDFVSEESIQDMTDNNIIQSCTHVANAAVDFIQKGENGTIWVVQDNQPGFAVKIPQYISQ